MAQERELSLIDEQAVKSTRFAHQLLLTACLASMVFAFSPQENNVYQNAVREMNALLSIDLEKIVFSEAMRHEGFSREYKKLSQILADYGILLSNNNTQDQNAAFHIGPETQFFASMSLEDINAYVTSISQLTLKISIIDKNFEGAIRSFLEENRGMLQKWGSAAYVGITNNSLGMGFYHPQNRQAGVTGTGEKLKSPTEAERTTIPIKIVSRLYENPETTILVSKVNDDYLFLPNTKQLWDQVRTENPPQARAILARKDTPQEKKLEVFGLSIPQRLIFWTIPAVIFALAINFLLHANNLSDRAKNNPEIGRYPWTMLMQGYLATAVLITTTIILPLTASAGAIITTWNSQTATLRLIAIALCAGTATAVTTGGIKTNQIRKRQAHAKQRKRGQAEPQPELN